MFLSIVEYKQTNGKSRQMGLSEVQEAYGIPIDQACSMDTLEDEKGLKMNL